ncbi:Metal-dependent hydrolase, beta-lactamase superfamily II [Carnobacterium iners]|uniref:Metal-dependent hydrolase, beta-lactamase superfamily II n=1 Tax=Carnobacterium iners TaxID=1073423 RepID=A0A1X7NQB1_9LACT|nr:MBL fold metallo-hydrolase [Carnobacterium iners]SEK28992.1 Metal-dependent hydrolase, beta-lactamase superfamily II [Carnobacterium iners]SMH39799.1 Metal-dependent hydrolase, beta-lactamase superfamily II [Carnobacterium iners]
MAYRKKKKKLTRKQKKQQKKLALLVAIILFSFLTGLFLGKDDQSRINFNDKINQFKEEWTLLFKEFSSKKNDENLESSQSAYFRILDVGQGSSTLLQSEDGTTILIDSGRYEDKEKKILTYLDHYIGTGGKIDLLIFTHNDSDHIGYGDLILQYYDVQEIWMNGYDSTSKIYERVLDAIENSQARYIEPKSGENHQVGPFDLEVLNPTVELRNNPNDDSIVTKISFADFSGLFSGDASIRVEKDIVEEKSIDLDADLLLMGHHGSKTSTSEEWIKAVQPKISVYSAGGNNGYDHPGKETINRLEKMAIPFYGTSKNGTVNVRANNDGTFTVETEKEE